MTELFGLGLFGLGLGLFGSVFGLRLIMPRVTQTVQELSCGQSAPRVRIVRDCTVKAFLARFFKGLFPFSLECFPVCLRLLVRYLAMS
jgi:hypothetical protein